MQPAACCKQPQILNIALRGSGCTVRVILCSRNIAHVANIPQIRHAWAVPACRGWRAFWALHCRRRSLKHVGLCISPAGVGNRTTMHHRCCAFRWKSSSQRRKALPTAKYAGGAIPQAVPFCMGGLYVCTKAAYRAMTRSWFISTAMQKDRLNKCWRAMLRVQTRRMIYGRSPAAQDK